MVPRMTVLFQTLADALLQRESRCRIQFLRCDAFELLEGHAQIRYFVARPEVRSLGDFLMRACVLPAV